MDFIEFKHFKEDLDCPDMAHEVDRLKKSFLLLKKKMCMSHDLIKQYNDKLKECEQIKSELDRVKDEADKTKRNYNVKLAKVIKLELQNSEYEKNAEVMTKRLAECETRIAGDKRHIQQLICKVEDIEDKHSEKVMQCELKKADLEVKVKELEQQLKAARKSHKIKVSKTKLKKMKKKTLSMDKCEPEENVYLQTDVISTEGVTVNTITDCNELKSKPATTEKSTLTDDVCLTNKKSVQDVGVNTVINFNELTLKPITSEKSTLTDEFYHFKDDPYPLFCAKCENKSFSFEKLYESTKCQPLLTEVLSPLPPSETIKVTEADRTEPVVSDSLRVDNVKNGSANHVDSVDENTALRALQKVNVLERKLKKLSKSNNITNNCCNHQPFHNCYSGVPSQMSLQSDLMFKFWEKMLEFTGQQQQGISNRKRKREERCNKPHRNKTASKKKRKVGNIVSNWAVETVAPDFEDELFVNNSSSIVHPNLRVKDKSTSVSINRSQNNFCYDNNDYRRLLDDKQQEYENDCVSLRSTQSKEDNSSISTISTYDLNDVRSCSNEETSRYSFDKQSSLSPDREIHKVSDKSVHSGNTEILRKYSRTQKPPKKTAQKRLLTKLKNLKKTNNKRPVFKSNLNNDIEKVNESNMRCENIPKITCNNRSVATSVITSNINNDNYIPMKRQRIAHVPQTKNLQSTIESVLDVEKLNALCDKVVVKSINEITDSSKDHVKQSCYKNDSENLVKIKKAANKTTILKKSKHIEMHDEIEQPNCAENCISDHDGDSNVSLSTQLQNSESDNSFDRCAVKDNAPIKSASISNYVSESSLFPSVNSSSTVPEPSSILATSSKDVSLSLNESAFKKDSKLDDVKVYSKLSQVTSSPTLHNSKTNGKRSPEKTVVDTVKRNLRSRVIMNESMNCVKKLRSRQIILTSKIHSLPKVTVNQEKESVKINKTALIESTCLNDIDNQEKESVETNESTLIESTCLNDIDNQEKASVEINKTTSIEPTYVNDIDKTIKQILSPISLLVQHLHIAPQHNKPSANVQKIVAKRISNKEKFVQTQLNRLIISDTWESTLHQDVVEQLSNFPKSHVILAKCIVDLLCEKANDDEPLDKTHTPPAPLMTKTQQKIVTLLVSLEPSIPTIFQLVQSGIEYKLFRLGYAPTIQESVELVRVFTALARIKKDRERVRIFCCDALYCLSLKAISIIYTVLTCWPEVFPMAGSNQEPLPKCITHLIMSQTAKNKFAKLLALKNLLSSYYKYPSSGQISDNLIKEFMVALQEKRYNGLDTAIILLAKREDTNWAYKNIVQGGLLQMIVNGSHPSIYEAFSLLGNILRSFSVNDKDGIVGNIIEQLCDLLNAGKASEEQQEGIVSALLSLSRHKFDAIIKHVIKWKPSKPLRSLTVDKFKSLFASHRLIYWKQFMWEQRLFPAKTRT